MPHRIVSQIGMLSLSPGATSLPSRPMIAPTMMRTMMSTTMLATFRCHGFVDLGAGVVCRLVHDARYPEQFDARKGARTPGRVCQRKPTVLEVGEPSSR